MHTITELLEASRAGDARAEPLIFTAIYDDLRAIARRHLSADRWHPAQTTSLVNETFLKLSRKTDLPYRDRAHLLSTASRAMRQILVDHARAELSQKRGSRPKHLAIELLPESEFAEVIEHNQLIQLDAALHKLAAFDERMAKLVELRFFGGMEFAEIEPLLGVTARTLKRDWRAARAFLYDAMQDEHG